ncbi:hypothetical protein BDR04DRAFT_1232896 [Suillus decipiens]|nr:hypothetical protein BDR04DRAFT_1232896 [Suillus decipiens]
MQARLDSSVYENITLHPSIGMTDVQLSCGISRQWIWRPLLSGVWQRYGRVTHDVLHECEEIRSSHDHRVERAVRAVMMLRDKFEWKQRVEVEVEEPEELEWDPRMGHEDVQMTDEKETTVTPDNGELGEGQSSDEEDIVEGELTGNDAPTPVASSSPAAVSVDVEMAPTNTSS